MLIAKASLFMLLQQLLQGEANFEYCRGRLVTSRWVGNNALQLVFLNGFSFYQPTAIDDPRKLIFAYRAAAEYAKKAGFDGVECSSA
jgi:hypothetical protein